MWQWLQLPISVLHTARWDHESFSLQTWDICTVLWVLNCFYFHPVCTHTNLLTAGLLPRMNYLPDFFFFKAQIWYPGFFFSCFHTVYNSNLSLFINFTRNVFKQNLNWHIFHTLHGHIPDHFCKQLKTCLYLAIKSQSLICNITLASMATDGDIKHRIMTSLQDQEGLALHWGS